MRKLVLLAVIASVVMAAWQESVKAIPAFARRYRLSCKTCHNPFPRLTAYGEEFAGNAFQLPDKEEPARSFVDVGDEKLSLLRDFPVAIRGDLYARALPDSPSGVEYDFQFPYRLKLLSGGSVYKDIAYYFYFYYDERGEVAGVDDAFIHFNNLLGQELDVIAGQFAVSDPLMKRELRLTYEDYHIYKLRVGESSVNLNYDRGVMVTFSPVSGTDIVFEVLNGNGNDKADENRNFDYDSFKNIFLRGSQELVEGVRLGAFYYFGRQTNSEITNSSRFWGIDGTFSFKEIFSCDWQYLERRDDDPFFTNIALEDSKTKGGLVEAVYAPKGADSNWYLIFLYNNIDSDLDIYDYETVTLNFSYLLLRNMRMFGEYTRDMEFEENKFTGGLSFAF